MSEAQQQPQQEAQPSAGPSDSCLDSSFICGLMVFLWETGIPTPSPTRSMQYAKRNATLHTCDTQRKQDIWRVLPGAWGPCMHGFSAAALEGRMCCRQGTSMNTRPACGKARSTQPASLLRHRKRSAFAARPRHHPQFNQPWAFIRNGLAEPYSLDSTWGQALAGVMCCGRRRGSGSPWPSCAWTRALTPCSMVSWCTMPSHHPPCATHVPTPCTATLPFLTGPVIGDYLRRVDACASHMKSKINITEAIRVRTGCLTVSLLHLVCAAWPAERTHSACASAAMCCANREGAGRKQGAGRRRDATRA